MEKELLSNPSRDDLWKKLSAEREDLFGATRKYCHNMRQRLKKARQYKGADGFTYNKCRIHMQRGEWRVYFREIYYFNKLSIYSPISTRIYRTFMEADGRIYVAIFGLSQLSSEHCYAPPIILSAHFLSRFRERELRDTSIPIDEVVKSVVELFIPDKKGLGTLRTPIIYGTDENKRNTVTQIGDGVCLGYFDYKKQVYHMETYLRNDMLNERQKYMTRISQYECDRCVDDDGFTVNFVTIDGDDIQKMGWQEYLDYLKRKDTEEFKREEMIRSMQQCRDNQKRYERKQRRPASPQHHLPKFRASYYGEEDVLPQQPMTFEKKEQL